MSETTSSSSSDAGGDKAVQAFVIGPVAVVRGSDGKSRYVYNGAPLPDGTPEEEVDRLVAKGLVKRGDPAQATLADLTPVPADSSRTTPGAHNVDEDQQQEAARRTGRVSAGADPDPADSGAGGGDGTAGSDAAAARRRASSSTSSSTSSKTSK